MKKHLLCQLQLSNYDTNGNWILECDSGFQMVMGRIREFLKLNPELFIDVIGPKLSTVITHPQKIVPDLFDSGRVKWIEIDIIPNALVTRFDFNFSQIHEALKFQGTAKNLEYDAVYINDPMQLRNYRVLFFTQAQKMPKFYVHSHFIDNPESPKFPRETSLWMGQIEAATFADYNFWQCESSMNIFFDSMDRFSRGEHVDMIKAKSAPWDDGYSSTEMNIPSNMNNVRFDVEILKKWKQEDKVIVFVPNRIGGRGRSSDYTNCGHFMFDILPQLKNFGVEPHKDYVVLAGNPSQKFSNQELEDECGKNGYVSLVPDTFTRDEFKLIAKYADLGIGIYNVDSFGGTVSRELIELGCRPIWIDCYEYSRMAREVMNVDPECGRQLGLDKLGKKDLSDLPEYTAKMIMNNKASNLFRNNPISVLQNIVRKRCSYESTTPQAMKIMNLLPNY